MGSPVSPLFRVPRVAETNIGNRVLGRTLMGLAGALVHLNVLQARGFVPISVYQDRALTAGSVFDVGYIQGQTERHETIIAPFFVPYGVDLLHVVLVMLSWESGSTQDPETTVTVEDDTGGIVDEGCTWSWVAGTLPGDDVPNAAGTDYMRPYLIESSARFLSTDPTSGPTDPRRLSVGSKEGSIVVFKVSSIRARCIAAWLLPVPPDSV